MLAYMQKIGRSLMVPVAVLPAAALIIGLGYWIESVSGDSNLLSTFLTSAGGALIDNMGILFCIGVGFGMSKDNHGSAALTALVGWLIVQKMCSDQTVGMLFGVELENVNPAFSKINNQFIGILVGVISANVYNYTYQVNLNPALSFFSGRRLSTIINSVVMLCVSLVLIFVWPFLFDGLVSFGEFITNFSAIGAGVYGFLNRLLIPLGLHHALNSVFWFDVAGINDIPNYLSGEGQAGVVGIYQAGFFPIMMFGLPAGALAMYHEALPSQKKAAAGLLLSGAIASFFTGVTEPLEFSFMFAAPLLYFMHAVYTGLALFIAASLQWIAGFGFSAGLVDYLLSFQNPLAINNYMLIPLGLAFAALYYFSFRFMIKKFNLKTPGRTEGELKVNNEKKDYDDIAKKLLDLIGSENLLDISNCTTRLRLVVKDSSIYNEKDFKDLSMLGLIKPAKTSLQIIVGPDVEFVSEALKKVHKG